MHRPIRHILLIALLCALVSGVVGPAGPAQARAGYGHTDGRDGVLRSGCHGYRYHWVIKPPTNDWLLETFLRDPRGKRLASGMFDSDSEQKRDHSRFRFCRYSTRPGRFAIHAKLTWYNGYAQHTVWLDPSHFRLRRR
jgi:hypothetical protein